MFHSGLHCQLCLEDWNHTDPNYFHRHMKTTQHRKNKAKVFQKEGVKWVYLKHIPPLQRHRGPYHIPSLQRHRGPYLGWPSLVTLYLSSESGSLFYLCHACEEPFSNRNDHFLAAEHCLNYYSYTDPDTVRFSWIQSERVRQCVDAHRETENNRVQHTGTMQVLDMPEDLFNTVKGSSYVKVMQTLSHNPHLLRLKTTAAGPKRMTIQTYLATASRKHPLLGLQHLVECLSEQQTDRRLYLCTVCNITLTHTKIINHLLSFYHIRCYINAWHPSTLQSYASYVYSPQFHSMMQDLATRMEELHGTTIADMKKVVVPPALFSSVEDTSYIEALKMLEDWRKQREESSLITCITPGDKLVHVLCYSPVVSVHVPGGKLKASSCSASQSDPVLSRKQSDLSTGKEIASQRCSHTDTSETQKRRISYTRDALIELRSCPAAQRKPQFLFFEPRIVLRPSQSHTPLAAKRPSQSPTPLAAKRPSQSPTPLAAKRPSQSHTPVAAKRPSQSHTPLAAKGPSWSQTPHHQPASNTATRADISYVLSCQVCSVKFETTAQYFKHVKGGEHKQKMKTIFVTEADELEKGRVYYSAFLNECRYVKKRHCVKGLHHIVTCISSHANSMPLCLCLVCHSTFPGSEFRAHLSDPAHTRPTQAHQNAAQLPAVSEGVLKALASQEEEEDNAHMMLKIIDLPSRILGMLNDDYWHVYKMLDEYFCKDWQREGPSPEFGVLSCQVCNWTVENPTEYCAHVQGRKHKQKTKAIFMTEADDLEKGQVLYDFSVCGEMLLYMKSTAREPVIGLLHIVTCVSSRGDSAPVCVCGVCRCTFLASCLREHVCHPIHIQETLKHQNAAQVQSENESLLTMAQKQEDAQGAGHMVLKIIELPSRIFAMLSSNYWHVCQILEKYFRKGWQHEVPNMVVTLDELQDSPTSPQLAGSSQLQTFPAVQGPSQTPTPLGAEGASQSETPLDVQGPSQSPTPPGAPGPSQSETPPAVQGPSQSETPPAVQGPSQSPTPPGAPGPSQSETPPAVQGPSQAETPPAVQGPSQAETPPAVQGPSQAETPPAVQGPSESETPHHQSSSAKCAAAEPPGGEMTVHQPTNAEPPNTVSKPEEAKHPVMFCVLSCQVCDMKFQTTWQYFSHVKGGEHKQKMKTIFVTEADELEKGRVFYSSILTECQYIKKEQRAEPVIGLLHVVMVVSARTNCTPRYACLVCECTFSASDFKAHLCDPTHITHTLMHQNPARLASAWNGSVCAEVLTSLAWQEENAQGADHMMIKIIDLPCSIFYMLSDDFQHVCHILDEYFRKDWRHEVPTEALKEIDKERPDVKDHTPQPVPVEKEAASEKDSCVHKPEEKKCSSQNTSVESRADNETLKQSTEEPKTEKGKEETHSEAVRVTGVPGEAVAVTGRRQRSGGQDTPRKRRADAGEEDEKTERGVASEDAAPRRVGRDLAPDLGSGAEGGTSQRKRQRRRQEEDDAAPADWPDILQGAWPLVRGDVNHTPPRPTPEQEAVPEEKDPRVREPDGRDRHDLRKEKELVAEQDTLHGLQPNAPRRPVDSDPEVTHSIQVSPRPPQSLLTTPSSSDRQPRPRTLIKVIIISDVQDKPVSPDLWQPAVQPPTSRCHPEDMVDPAVTNTALWNYLNNTERTEPVIGLSMMTEFQWPVEHSGRNYFRCHCCSRDLLRSQHTAHIISAKHRFNYIKKACPRMVSDWPSRVEPNERPRELRELALQLEREEGWGRLKVTVMRSSTSQSQKTTAKAPVEARVTSQTTDVSPKMNEDLRMILISKTVAELTELSKSCLTDDESTMASDASAAYSELAVGSKATATPSIASKPVDPCHAAAISSATSHLTSHPTQTTSSATPTTSRTTADSKPILTAAMFKCTTTISKPTEGNGINESPNQDSESSPTHTVPPDAQTQSPRSCDVQPESSEGPRIQPWAPHDPVAQPWAPHDPMAQPWAPHDPLSQPWAPHDPMSQPWAPHDPMSQPWAPHDPMSQPWAPQVPGTWQRAPQDCDTQPWAPRYLSAPWYQSAPQDPSGVHAQDPEEQREAQTLQVCPDRRTFSGPEPPVCHRSSAGERIASRVSLFLNVKLSEAERKRVVGLWSVLECQCGDISKNERLVPFYLCRSCQETVQLKHICGHVISTDHQRNYMWEKYPKMMAGIWSLEDLSEKEKMDDFEVAVNTIAEQEQLYQMDAKVILLDKDSYHRVCVASFNEGIHILESSRPPEADESTDDEETDRIVKAIAERMSERPHPERIATMDARNSTITVTIKQEVKREEQHHAPCCLPGHTVTIKQEVKREEQHHAPCCLPGHTEMRKAVKHGLDDVSSNEDGETGKRRRISKSPDGRKLELVLNSLKILASSNFSLGSSPPLSPEEAAEPAVDTNYQATAADVVIVYPPVASGGPQLDCNQNVSAGEASAVNTNPALTSQAGICNATASPFDIAAGSVAAVSPNHASQQFTGSDYVGVNRPTVATLNPGCYGTYAYPPYSQLTQNLYFPHGYPSGSGTQDSYFTHGYPCRTGPAGIHHHAPDPVFSQYANYSVGSAGGWNPVRTPPQQGTGGQNVIPGGAYTTTPPADVQRQQQPH